MGLFRRTRREQAPLLPPEAPVEEHLDAILASRPGAVYALVRALAARPLYQASRGLPRDGTDPATGVVLHPFEYTVARTTMPDGSPGAMVSTTPELVLARTPDSVPVGRPGDELLAELVGDPSLTGLVLNPAARHQVLLKEWIRDGLAGRTA
jgi:hypothetical protein